MLSFTKMNGAGNDFVLLDNRDGAIRLTPPVIERLCDRHRGIGADGVLLLEKGAPFRMRYYNRDGGEAEMCGNGARCFARFANRLAGPLEEVQFETMAGVVRARLVGDSVRLVMSAPKDLLLNRKLRVEGEEFTVHSVNTGVPHAVVFVDDLERVDVARLGAAIRLHELFAPQGTNVNFVSPEGVRTFERGVEAETLACGTGVVAVALVSHLLTGAASPVGVRVRGGDLLHVGFEEHNGVFENVTLTGPADFVFDGRIEETPAAPLL